MHIKDIALNLLRLFDAVYRTRNVSRAAELLDLTQPAASQALTRLRLLIKDPLFVRAGGGVQGLLEEALNESALFDPLQSHKVFRIHMSDIGEGRFLPDMMVALQHQAPGVRVETLPVPRHEIPQRLDSGAIDFAFGFLPTVKDTQRVQLIQDRYVVLLRAGHPFATKKRSSPALLSALRQLEFVAVRTHSDTLRILEMQQLQDRIRLTTEHFMVLPAIVRATDLAVVMPRNIARTFAADGGYSLIDPALPLRDFTVSLHWSRRFESDPGNQWMRGLIEQLFKE